MAKFILSDKWDGEKTGMSKANNNKVHYGNLEFDASSVHRSVVIWFSPATGRFDHLLILQLYASMATLF